jgi:hypothetical protein
MPLDDVDLRNDSMQELCRNGGILSLSLTILKLGVPEGLKGSMDIASSVSRLKAKILSIVSWSWVLNNYYFTLLKSSTTTVCYVHNIELVAKYLV